jgi:uncharacterized protein YkwD
MKRKSMPLKKIIFSIFAGSFLFLAALPCFSQESIKAEMLTEVNKLRASGCQCGEEKMPPAGLLQWDDNLEKAAAKHAKDLYDHEFLSHTGSDGSDLGDRATAMGYIWYFIGENIDWGHDTPEGAVEGWVSSPEHCKNMMNPMFKDIAVARKGEYWVMELGIKK